MSLAIVCDGDRCENISNAHPHSYDLDRQLKKDGWVTDSHKHFCDECVAIAVYSYFILRRK